MDAKDLQNDCIKSINAVKGTGMKPGITLIIPHGNGKNKYCYPFGKNGPRGEIVQYGIPEGCDTAIFDAIDMLAFLVVMQTKLKG